MTESQKTSSLVNLGPSSNELFSDEPPIVDSILPSEPPSQNQPNVLLDFGDSFVSNPPAENPFQETNANLLGGFEPAPQAPKVPQPMGKANVHDLFNTDNGVGSDVLAPMMVPKAKPATPTASEPSKSASEMLIDDMLDKLTVDKAPSVQSGGPPTSAPQGKPNYNSSFFKESAAARNKPKVPSKSDFGDLLGGFVPTSEAANRPIGEMKKEEEKKSMDPDQAVIYEWTHGKSRNLRALLCSLDSVIWSGSRWTKCGMHQLVTHNDVKKMYRKACLAVHPDKQTGTDNENLSKLIFTELNDGWSKFQEDEPA